jgi:integrase
MEEHWGRERFRLSKRTKTVEQHWKRKIEPVFGRMVYSTVTRAMIRRWMNTMESTPYEANRCKEILSFIFKHAEKHDHIPEGSRNPCNGVDSFTEKSREIYASPEELQNIWKELDLEAVYSPERVAFLRILLLTGSRPRALEGAKRSELKREADGSAILTSRGKSTEKTGRNEKVIFPPQALAILDELPVVPRDQLIGCKYPVALWNRIRNRLGYGHLRGRDLRRTFGTLARSSGENLDVIGELLNHTDSNTTKIYAKLADKSRIAASKRIATSIEALLRADA